MKTIALIAAFFVGAAAAQAPAPEQPKGDAPKPGAALNLKLDDGARGAPRILFGTPPAAMTKEEREKGLPDLGGKPSDEFNKPMSSSRPGSVIPKAFDPVMNQ